MVGEVLSDHLCWFYIVTEVPVTSLSANLDKGCDHDHDYIEYNDFTRRNHNHIVVTSAAMTSSSEALARGGEKRI